MNRRGGLYSGLLAAVVIICCLVLTANISNIYSGVHERFGMLQGGVLGLAAQMRFVESQLSLSADYALNYAVSDRIPSSELAARGCPGGFELVVQSKKVYCPVLNHIDFPREIRRPDILQALQVSFNEKMRGYVDKYNYLQPDIIIPSDFEVMPFDDYTAVVGMRPVRLKIKDLEGVSVGEASFRPAFKKDGNEFLVKDYPSFLDVVEQAAACADRGCVERLLPEGASLMDVDGKLVFLFPAFDTHYCFALHFVPQL